MRLTLRKQLKPFTSFKQLADELNITIPELKKRIRKIESDGELSLEALLARTEKVEEVSDEGVFELFHQFERCLVCGGEMTDPPQRDIGWGEFKQCTKCLYSAHEMANFQHRKKAAEDQLEELMLQAQKTKQVLHDRKLNSDELWTKQPLR